MKVLWFTNIPMPAVDEQSGTVTRGSGHWMTALLDEVRRRTPIDLTVVTAYPRLPDMDFEQAGVRYVVVGQPRLTSHFACRRADVDKCAAIVARIRPDVVHVHGTERFYGLLSARRLIESPTVVSIQGLISACVPNFFGTLGPLDIVRAHSIREVLTKRGLVWDYLSFVQGISQEEEILRSAPAFMGRTSWDRAHVGRLNPTARYFHVDELLRPEFGSAAWSLGECKRATVFVTNVGTPLRGAETVLAAAQILRARGVDVALRFAGTCSERSGYGRFVRRRIDSLGLRDRVTFTGFLTGKELVTELVRANAYVLASHIENSPNSLAEAMRVGVPCVAAYTGGIPSLVADGRSGVLFPPGDPAMLAASLERVLSDGAFASSLGAVAREEAARRHDPGVVCSQVMNAYESVQRGDGGHRQ